MTGDQVGMRKMEIRLSYRGTAYCGWQVQPGVNTVQREVDAALKSILGHSVKTLGASRTDTGVHAHDQHVTFETANPIPLDALHRALDQHLPPDIAVLSVRTCAPEFSVRYHARAKHYAYFIFNRNALGYPFLAYLGWRVGVPLEVSAMDEAARVLPGRKDFRAFQSRRDHRAFSHTELTHASVRRSGDLIQIDVVGAHFLYHMVRNIVGSLVKVGLGQWSLAEFRRRFERGDRRAMGMTAPGHGLHLMRVFYGPPPYVPDPAADRFVRGLDAWFSP